MIYLDPEEKKAISRLIRIVGPELAQNFKFKDLYNNPHSKLKYYRFLIKGVYFKLGHAYIPFNPDLTSFVSGSFGRIYENDPGPSLNFLVESFLPNYQRKIKLPYRRNT